MPRKPDRDKTKELFWRRALARQLESGLSQAAFCQRDDLNPNNFSWWKGEITRRDAAAQRPAVAIDSKDLFIPLDTVNVCAQPSDGVRAVAEIVGPGLVVRILLGIDRHSLIEIMCALKEVSG